MFDTLASHVKLANVNTLQKLWNLRHWSLKYALMWPIRHLRYRFSGHSEQNDESEQRLAQIIAAGERIPDDLIFLHMVLNYLNAENNYLGDSYSGDITLFRATQARFEFLVAGPQLGWQDLVQGKINMYNFDCDHEGIMFEPTIGEIGKILSRLMLE